MAQLAPLVQLRELVVYGDFLGLATRVSYQEGRGLGNMKGVLGVIQGIRRGEESYLGWLRRVGCCRDRVVGEGGRQRVVGGCVCGLQGAAGTIGTIACAGIVWGTPGASSKSKLPRSKA